MRILWTIANWKRTGPVDPSLDLAAALRDRGHDVRVHVGAVPRGVAAENTAADAARVRDLPIAPGRPRLSKHGAPWRDLLDVRRLRRSIEAWRPDGIVTTLAGDHRIAVAAARGAIPVARLLFAAPPLVVDRRERRALVRTATLFPFAEGVEADLEALGVARDRIVPIDAPLDVERLTRLARDGAGARERFGVVPGVPLFGIVARHQRHRRFDLLWDALVRLRDTGRRFTFAVPGRGTASDELVAQPIERLGLADLVVRPGYLVGADYAGFLASWDAIVFLVPGSDPTCRALREAMALGVPAVATRRGLLPSIVEHEATGLVLDDETPEGLAAALARLLDDPALARRLGAAAAERTRARGDARRVAERIEERIAP